MVIFPHLINNVHSVILIARNARHNKIIAHHAKMDIINTMIMIISFGYVWKDVLISTSLKEANVSNALMKIVKHATQMEYAKCVLLRSCYIMDNVKVVHQPIY